jgi:hypothetical protein
MSHSLERCQREICWHELKFHTYMGPCMLCACEHHISINETWKEKHLFKMESL